MELNRGRALTSPRALLLPLILALVPGLSLSTLAAPPPTAATQPAAEAKTPDVLDAPPDVLADAPPDVPSDVPSDVPIIPPGTPTSAQAAPPAIPTGAPASPPTTPPDAPDGIADPAIELFVSKCSSCHTVGEGPRVGPDLKGVVASQGPEWVHRFVTQPSAMLDTDPRLGKLIVQFSGVRMPDLGLDSKQVDSLVELLAKCSDTPCKLVGQFVPAIQATAADFARGERLFLGTEPKQNGGPGCISCHTVLGHDGGISGGLIAKDLTHAFARLGDASLDAALKSPTYALMNRIFADHPLTSAEVFALRAFLYQADTVVGQPRDSSNFLLVGLGGAGLMLIFLNALWSRRLRGVRKVITRSKRSAP